MMERILLALGLVALIVGAAAAGDIYVPDSTPSGTCNNFPFNPNWSGANGEWRYQAVFTAAQLGNTPLLITGLSLAPCSTGVFTATTFEIRMNNLTPSTHSTALDTNIGASPTVVRGAAAFTWNTTNATWSPLAFTCPHQYDGKSDLVVEVRYIGGAMSGGFGGTVARAGAAPRYFVYGTGAYTGTTGTSGGLTGFKVRLTCADVTPSTLGPSIGTTVKLALDSYPDAGVSYVCASSLGAGPFMVGCWPVKLSVDGIFLITANNMLPALFQNYQGVLDASGQATAAVNIPNIPVLVGIGVYTAFAGVAPGGLTVVSDNGLFRINP
ncbi:MAG: hypothetical protein JXQ29_18835 [Planctomycetes bacterium]|nr:hypothetical protein [Planctomycetota bacterium]